MRCQKCGFTNSPTARFCKQCGAPLPHGTVSKPAAFDTAVATEHDNGTVLSATFEPETAAPDNATMPVAPDPATQAVMSCPQCTTPRVNSKRFCRQCRFDFSTTDTASGQPAVSKPDAEMLAEQRAEAAAREAEQREAEQRAAQARAVEQKAAEAHAAEQRAAEARAIEAQSLATTAVDVEGCPQCATLRVAGKRFCRSCRYDFVEQTPHEDVAATPIAEPKHGGTPAAPEQNQPATGKAEHPASAPPAAESKPGTPQSPGINVTPPSAGEPQAPSPAAPVPGVNEKPPQPRREQLQPEDKPVHPNKTAVIVVAAVAVIGIAVGAGFFIRSLHAKHADDQPLEASSAASAPLAAAPASMPAPATLPTLPAATEPAGALASSSAPANIVDAGGASTPVADAASAPVPALAQQPVQPSTDNSAAPAIETPTPTPKHDVTTALDEPPAHPKPRKSAPPADAGGQNATIRAAIDGSLADGNSCFGNKKFDCAITNADAVLRLDPRNNQALSLRRRAKAAQDSALNALSIQ